MSSSGAGYLTNWAGEPWPVAACLMQKPEQEIRKHLVALQPAVAIGRNRRPSPGHNTGTKTAY